MNQWLARFSKNTIAFVAIVGGIFFIIMAQPPHSVCDSQIEVLIDSQKHFLYKDPPKSKVIKTTTYEAQYGRCQSTGNPGGCYELFQGINELLENLNTVTLECAPASGSVAEVQKALWDTAELLLRLAWGDKPPESYNAKFGWLDKADMTLFCKLKTRLTAMYGEAKWTTFRDRMMLELPGARDLTRTQVWELSLLSEICSQYP